MFMEFLSGLFAPFPKSASFRSASPDEIIAAAVVESFAKNYSDWKYVGKEIGSSYRDIPAPGWPDIHTDKYRYLRFITVNRYLKNSAKDIEVFWYDQRYREKEGRINFYVNGTGLDDIAGRVIADKFKELKAKHDELAALDAKLKAEIKRTEDAWNLAEKLLGKKRLKSGALVPAESFCETCVRHDGQPIETHNGVVYKCTGCQEKERKCTSLTDSSVSVSTTVAPSKRVKAAARSVRPKNTGSTKSSTRLTPVSESIAAEVVKVSSSELLRPL